jgi:hypothetical protein
VTGPYPKPPFMVEYVIPIGQGPLASMLFEGDISLDWCGGEDVIYLEDGLEEENWVVIDNHQENKYEVTHGLTVVSKYPIVPPPPNCINPWISPPSLIGWPLYSYLVIA